MQVLSVRLPCQGSGRPRTAILKLRNLRMAKKSDCFQSWDKTEGNSKATTAGATTAPCPTPCPEVMEKGGSRGTSWVERTALGEGVAGSSQHSSRKELGEHALILTFLGSFISCLAFTKQTIPEPVATHSKRKRKPSWWAKINNPPWPWDNSMGFPT